MRYITPEALRFLTAGAINTALGYGLFCALLHIWSYPTAYSVAYVAGVFTSYALNCWFVFHTRPSLTSALQFPMVYIAQYVIGISILTLLVKALGLEPRLAALGVVVVTIPVTFIISRLIIKRERPQFFRTET